VKKEEEHEPLTFIRAAKHHHLFYPTFSITVKQGVAVFFFSHLFQTVKMANSEI